MSELRERYFKTLGLGNDKKRYENALSRAYEIRNFEIELYWKRATYFWGFQLAMFTAFGLLWQTIGSHDPAISDQWGPLTCLLSALGILTAIASFLSSKGSRFWQNNWELHIDMLEDEIQGRLYKTVWTDRGRFGYSVTRLNMVLGTFLIVFWSLATLYAVWKFLGTPLEAEHISVAMVIGLVVAIGATLLCAQRTGVTGSIPDGEGNHGQTVRVGRFSGRVGGGSIPAFVRRYSPGDKEKGEQSRSWLMGKLLAITGVSVIFAAICAPSVVELMTISDTRAAFELDRAVYQRYLQNRPDTRPTPEEFFDPPYLKMFDLSTSKYLNTKGYFAPDGNNWVAWPVRTKTAAIIFLLPGRHLRSGT